MEKKKILCPTEFTTVTNNALSYAIDFTQRLHADLILLHIINDAFVATPKTESGDHPFCSGLEKVVQQKMESLQSEIRANYPNTNIDVFVARGRMEEIIPDMMINKGVDLIVMGYLGETGANTSFGDVSIKKLMDSISVPVLIIPIESSYSPLHHWLYTSDLNRNDEEKLIKLLEYTLPLDANLELLYVRQNNKKKMEDLENFTELLKKFADKKIVFTEIESEDILEGIEEYAWNNKPDLLIVAKQDKSQLEKLFKRDKVAELVNHIDLPILVLHEK